MSQTIVRTLVVSRLARPVPGVMSSAVSLRALMLAAGLMLLAGAPAALAQSVSGTGDIVPGLPTSPLASWDLGGGQLLVGYGHYSTGTLTIENGGTVSNTRGYVGLGYASVGAVTVTGTGSTWSNSDVLYIGYEGTGTLTIADGGLVTSSTHVYLGDYSDSTGTVTVTGSGSTWANSGTLSVGSYGTGTLTIENGGSVSNAAAAVGDRFGSTGTVTVTGAGSTWTSSGTLYVGISGTGTLTIANGGTVSNINGRVGSVSGSTGTVTVTGAGSTWTNSGSLTVGLEGTGTLAIENGGTVSSTNGQVGSVAGSSGTVTVTGAGSSWASSGLLYVGQAGSGTLTIADGGRVTNTIAYLGSSPGGSGTVKVTGAGSTWANAGLLRVGLRGTGTLTIENGGTVSNTDTFVGYLAGSSGTVTVTGAGSTWTNSGELHVGSAGTGTLTIADGGKVSNTVGVVGLESSGTGTATVTGGGSTWTNSAELYVGHQGTGTLTIENGGTVSNTNSYVGVGPASTGTVTVTGAGSTWTNNGKLSIGYEGTGTLTIADGGTVTSAGAGGPAGSIGVMAGSTGTVTVTGAGSTWTNSGSLAEGDLYVGEAGTGTLIVENGGVVSSASGYVGFASGSTGTVTVTGAGSRWDFHGVVDVGRDGTGTLTIAEGGTVQGTTWSYIGKNGSGSGAVTVTGAGSAWYNNSIIEIGNAGTLTVEKGGHVRTAGVLFYSGGGGGGTLNLLGDATNGRGVLEINYLTANDGTVNLNGGILRARMNHTSFFDSVGVQTIGANGAFFDSNGYDIGVSASFDGSGGLTKRGAGTLTLTGANSYTGGTTILGGTLSISSDVNLGAASGGLTLDGGTLQVTGSFTSNRAVTLGAGGGTIEVASFQGLMHTGPIFGNGGLTKTGGGELILTGTSTYSGATTVSSGTLHIDNSHAMSAASDYTVAAGALLRVSGSHGTVTAGSIAGAGSIRIESDSTLEVGATNASTSFSGMIYDFGSLRKVGTGTLTLTQENTYSGGTTIAGGAISISKESNLGNTSGALTLDGGVLQVTGTTLHELTRSIVLGSKGGGFDIVEAGNSFTVNQSLSGTGSLSKTGAGTLVLKGASSYSGATTVSEGTLRAGAANAFSGNSTVTVASGATLDLANLNQTIGSLAGAGTVTLGSGTLTAGANNSSTTFSGKITGSGGVTKAGTGTLTLTGTNTYTGSTKVSGGKLVVNGSLASSVTLDGGTLGGSGTIGGVTVQSGATVAPGNSIGTLTISGNVSFAAGSVYQVEVNAAGQSDRIVASGTATLSGGTVEVLAESGDYAASTDYVILTASGGVSGRFDTVTSNLAFLTPSLSYGGSSVTLTMTRNQTLFLGVAQSRNQGFAAVAAEALGAGNPVYDALLSATAAEARAGFDLVSGEAHAQGVAAMIGESALVREAVLGRLRGPLLTAPGREVAASFSADLPGRKGAVLLSAPSPQPRYVLWGEALGGQGNTNADGNAAGLERRTGGAMLGADLTLHDAPGSSLRVGVAGGYSQSRFDLDARLSSGKLESGHAGLYAGARLGSLRLDVGAAYSWSESDIRRQVQIRGFGDALRLQRPGSVLQTFAELGHGFAFQGFALEPFAQLALIKVSAEAGTERGGAAALRVLSSDQTLGFTTLGLRAEAQIGSAPFFARAMLGWRHGFGELTPQARTAFVSGSTPGRVFAAKIDRDALTAEAGLDWRASASTKLGLTYAASLGERARDHALKGRVDVRF